MALPTELTQVTGELPYALRLDVEGYVRSVDDALPAIYEDAEVQRDEVPREQFLFFAGVWRLWTQVDSQRWLVRNSLGLAQEFGADGIQAGSFSIARGADDVREIRELHNSFRRWLQQREFEFVARVDGVRSLLQQLQATQRNGR